MVHHRVLVKQFTEMLPPACIDTVDVLQQSTGILAEKWYRATFRRTVYFLDCSEEGFHVVRIRILSLVFPEDDLASIYSLLVVRETVLQPLLYDRLSSCGCSEGQL